MRIWPLLFLAALALAVWSGLLRAENDPPSWAIAVHLATVVLVGLAELLRRGSKAPAGAPDAAR